MAYDSDPLSTLLDNSAADQEEWRRAAGNLPGNANSAYQSLAQSLSAVRQRARGAVAELDGLAGDDMSNPAGVRRHAEDVLTGARQAVDDAARSTEVALTTMRASLELAALPALPDADRLTARNDARMILDAADGATVHDTLSRLAGRSDSVGALAASSWGADYLASRGADAELAQESHRTARLTAVQAATASGDPARSAAARVHSTLDRLAGVRDGTIQGAAGLLDGQADRLPGRPE